MSSVVDTVFGGSDDSGQEAQIEANERTQEFIAQQAEQARKDVLALLPRADENRNLGAQAALDVLGRAIPAQVGSLFRGEGQAQRNLLGGLSQFERSILGLPGEITTGLGGQPFAPDLAFTQQNLPQFTSSQEAPPGPEATAGGFTDLLAGHFGEGTQDWAGTVPPDWLEGVIHSGEVTSVPDAVATLRQRLENAYGPTAFDGIDGGGTLDEIKQRVDSKYGFGTFDTVVGSF